MPITAASAASPIAEVLSPAPSARPSQEDLKTREAFQEFVAGTFYGQMLKALRSTQSKPAYFHGGAAEDVFQAQFDQQIAGDLAREHGAQFAGPLFNAFIRQVGGNPTAAPTA